MRSKQTRRKRRFPLSTSHEALLVDGSDTEFRILVDDMLAFASTIEEVRNRLGRLIGVSGTQYTVLATIACLANTMPDLGVNQLAEHMHLSGAFVTIEVNKLVEAGLVAKAPHPEDKRRVMLTVTDVAVARMEALSKIQCPTNDALFDQLTAHDFTALRGILAKLAHTGERALDLIETMAPGGVLEEAAGKAAATATA